MQDLLSGFVLFQANLTKVLKAHGWDRVAEWIDVLSGGEKQRMAVSELQECFP